MSEPTVTYIGPCTVQEQYDEKFHQHRIRVSRIAKGKRHEMRMFVAGDLSAETTEGLRQKTLDKAMREIEHTLFREIEHSFPYLPWNPADEKGMLDWLTRFRLPCRLWPSNYLRGPWEIRDLHSEIMLTVPGECETAALFVGLLNALPILLLARE